MKVVTKQEIKDLVQNGSIPKIVRGDALGKREYLDFREYLIKIDNHYVPASYLFYDDSGIEKDSYIEDKNASLPRIVFHKDSGKYIIAFDSPDIGGYDVQEFEWFFDSIEDAIKEMKDE